MNNVYMGTPLNNSIDKEGSRMIRKGLRGDLSTGTGSIDPPEPERLDRDVRFKVRFCWRG